MLIDCHIHTGKSLNFDMPQAMVLESMKKYHVDFALVSDCRGAECDHDQNPLPKSRQVPQITLNQDLLDFVRAHPKELGAMLWIKPATEGCTPEFMSLIEKNRSIIYGLKVHPYHSHIPFDGPQMKPYLDLAQDLGLGILTHTATDDDSSPLRVQRAASAYPAVNFVMGHMELGSPDNELAIKLIAETPNLYGDTAWVKPENCLKALKVCGAEKILFGTDNPIDGVDTYDHPEFYRVYLGKMRSLLSPEIRDQLFWKNAARVFKIKL